MRATIVTTFFAAVLFAATQASAAIVSISDLYDPTDVLFDQVTGGSGACTGLNPGHDATGDTPTVATTCNSLSYQHSLLPEFNSAIHDLLAATLTLYFRDDETQVQGVAEEYTLSLDGTGSGPFIIPSGTSSSFGYDVQAQMDPDGLLQVIIARTGPGTSSDNDFFFERSIVNARFDDNPPPPDVSAVPEPSSLLLLGSGLAAAARRYRKRRQTQNT